LRGVGLSLVVLNHTFLIISFIRGCIMDKKISLDLMDLDGNAFNLMGAFRKQAKKENWTNEEIDEVLNECQKGDYNHLLNTLLTHTN